MRILTIQCPNCKDKIYSRAQHDFRSCSCGKSSVDTAMMEDALLTPWRLIGLACEGKQKVIELDVTEKELRDDWNYSINKYGLIKGDL